MRGEEGGAGLISNPDLKALPGFLFSLSGKAKLNTKHTYRTKLLLVVLNNFDGPYMTIDDIQSAEPLIKLGFKKNGFSKIDSFIPMLHYITSYGDISHGNCTGTRSCQLFARINADIA